MSLALILAAILSPAAAPEAGRPPAAQVRVDRSLDDSDRLDELDIAIRAALARGEIDRSSADGLHLAVARARRQMFRMGMQVSYRQRVRLRQRIDGLYARLAARRSAAAR